MKRALSLAAAAVLASLAPAAGPLKDELKVDASNAGVLRTRFASYGYFPARSIVQEAGGGYRFVLPAGVAGVGQTGVYSSFTLSGDCEVWFTFELLKLQPPREGYGSGVGLAFDVGEEVGRGSIQRVDKPAKESVYVLQTSPGTGPAKVRLKDEYRSVATTARSGRIGLRRVNKDLIFLASDDPAAPPKEVGQLPFTDGTVRAVRFFADTGGSPTAVDVRVRDIQARAEQITGGVPRREAVRSRWWWALALVPVAGAGLLLWRWRAHRRAALSV
jgi:hypothetical protein